MNSPSLAELSILRNRVSECLKLYYQSPLGSPYEAYEMLKQARSEYSQKCVSYVEEMLDNYQDNQLDSQCKECENVSTETEEPIDVNTRILLEKMR